MNSLLETYIKELEKVETVEQFKCIVSRLSEMMHRPRKT